MPDIRGLGYLQVQTAELSRWRTFALDGIGWASGKGTSDDVLALRMDERRGRPKRSSPSTPPQARRPRCTSGRRRCWVSCHVVRSEWAVRSRGRGRGCGSWA